MTDEEKELWKAVLLTRIAAGADAMTAIAEATQVLKAFRDAMQRRRAEADRIS